MAAAQPVAVGPTPPHGPWPMFMRKEMMQNGLIFATAGFALNAARKVAARLWEVLKKYFFVRVEVDSRDDTYRWLMQWLAERLPPNSTADYIVTSSLARFGYSAPVTCGEDTLRTQRPLMLFVPSGNHFIKYKNRWIWVTREADNPGGVAKGVETIRLTSLGWSRGLIESLLWEAHALYKERESGRTTVYVSDQYGNWNKKASRALRPLSSLVLPAGVGETLLEDCRKFINSERWYLDHGIPYRRGYLLHGPPGTGKSSFVTVLAGQLRMPIYVVNLASKVTDEVLSDLLSSAPTHSLLLLEDIDSAFANRDGSQDVCVTFSGLLNAIDGVAAQEGRLLFMTTNHPELLDPALVRPGRIDVRIEIGLANKTQVRQFFEMFYEDIATPTPLTTLADQFTEQVPDKALSMAQLQAFFLLHRDSPMEAIANVASHVK
eukprot:Colp12_sorted_trinity150504_noHs@16248